MKKCKHSYELDGGPCIKCGMTVSELFNEPKKMKKVKTSKKISYLDYQCMIGEKVQWDNLAKEHFEGRLLKMDENCMATVKLDDGTEVEVQC